MYTSQITFTLDTICPWTYLAKKRLAAALAQLPAHVTSRVAFAFPTIQIRPYQLYPDPDKAFGPEAATTPPDRYVWQRDKKFLGSEETMQRFTQAMAAYGAAEGIQFVFQGPIGDTLHAHRVIWYFQEQEQQQASSENEEGGIGSKIVDALYRRYFEQGQHPSSHETLLAACVEAGVPEPEARRVVVEDEGLGLAGVRAALRKAAQDGVDSVPTVVFEGKRRDITLVGAKEVRDYVKAMETIAKEST